MSNEFWIGLLASIPIGILTSLLTLPVQSWIERFSKNQGTKKRTRQRNEMAAILYLRKRPEVFTQYMLELQLRVLLVGMTVGAYYLSLPAARDVQEALAASRSVPRWLLTTGGLSPRFLEHMVQLALSVGAISGSALIMPIIRIWRLYRDPGYFKQFPADVIESLELVEEPDLRKLAKKNLPFL